jgi:hypothetical protein
VLGPELLDDEEFVVELVFDGDGEGDGEGDGVAGVEDDVDPPSPVDEGVVFLPSDRLSLR